jgi:NADH-quinone oxidoreductase subunit L
MELFLYTALFSPLVGSMFAALFAASPKTKWAGIIPSILLGVSLLSSLVLLTLVMSTGHTIHVEMMTWMETGDLYIPFGFVVDQISVTMMMVVTLVSTVVHVYAIGYMDHDK